ncbi:zinc finger protein 62 homolog [Sabethes cyaneus]|uniref:zinc finger protein 62 homolog n=1 Tax=Sabethes cyaneus TaxID=53552 RepID=UPI00237D81A7|nr:zinc finger protein 62 homolog [Sabethes cyaneus]
MAKTLVESAESETVIGSSNDGTKTSTCPTCRKSFRSSRQCERHIATVHCPKSEATTSKAEQQHCKQCDKSFKSTKLLQTHEKTHRKQVPNQEQHSDAADGAAEKDALPCEKCNAVFRSREGRRVHMILKHSAGPTYRCQECPMIFARKANLRLHMTTHGVRPHVCSVCGKSFARIESLRSHEQRCATGDKGLSCDECGRRFRKQELLEKHLQQGHPEREHVCGHCGQSFETKRALSHHVRVHEGQHRCTHCTLQFVTEKALQNHERSRHWEVLGLERIVGKQGRRKDRLEEASKPKTRIRRNKHCPFLGLEHLAERPAVEESANLESNADAPDETSANQADPENIPEEVEAKTAKFETTDDESQSQREVVDEICLKDTLPKDSRDLIKLALEGPDLLNEKDSFRAEELKSENKVHQPGITDDKEDHDKVTAPSEWPEPVQPSMDNSSSDNENADFEAGSVESEPPLESQVELDSVVLNSEPEKKSEKFTKDKKAPTSRKPTKQKPFPCDQCDNKSFAHRYWLVAHREKVHGIREPKTEHQPPKKGRTHFCNECDKSFSDWRNMVYHFKHVHKLQFNESELQQCQSCKKKFIYAEELKTHTCTRSIFVNRQPYYKCELCGKAYHSQHGLDCHRSVHQEFQRFNCDVCQKAFANVKDMNYHKKRVHVEASYVCDVCGKGFKLHTQLKVHAQIHQQQKRHQCEFCGKSFAQRNGMTAHLRIAHAEQLGTAALAEREITCDLCGKKLKGKICLKLHMKLHADDRNFACSYCDKKFIVKQDKIRHEQNHTKEYRFKCRFCDKGSTRRKLILVHEAKQHNVTVNEDLGPSHVCTVCGRSFLSPSALQIHMSLHSCELPVPCTRCDRRFKNVKYMKYHLKAHHQLLDALPVPPAPEVETTVITVDSSNVLPLAEESQPQQQQQQLIQPAGQQLQMIEVCGDRNDVTVVYVEYTVEQQQVKEFLLQNC